MQGGIVCVMILGRDGTHGKGRCVWGFVSEPCNSKAFEKMLKAFRNRSNSPQAAQTVSDF